MHVLSIPPGHWSSCPWPNGCIRPDIAARTWSKPNSEWQEPFERWLNDYTWPAQPSRAQIEAVLMRAPFSLRPADFCSTLTWARIVLLMEMAGEKQPSRTSDDGAQPSERPQTVEEARGWKIARALNLLTRGWTVDEIAKDVRLHRGTLYRDPTFRAAMEKLPPGRGVARATDSEF